MGRKEVHVTAFEFSVAALVIYRLSILVAGISLTYMGYRLFFAGDPKLTLAASLFAIGGAVGMLLSFSLTPRGLDPRDALSAARVSSVPDSVMQIVLRSMCHAPLAKDDRARFLTWYAAEGRRCP